MGKWRFNKKVFAAVMTGILIVVVAAWVTWRLWPPTADSLRRSVTVVECHTYNELHYGGHVVLFFNGVDNDKCLAQASTLQSEATDTIYTTATWVNRWSFWPSCRGRLITIAPGVAGLDGCNIDSVLSRTLKAEQIRLKRLRSERSELTYYLRVHGVQDPGYQSVAKVATQRDSAIAKSSKLVDVLRELTDKSSAKSRTTVKKISHFIAYYHGVGDTLRHVECQLLGDNTQRRVALLRTVDEQTPDGVVAVNVLPWNHYAEGDARAISFVGLGVKTFADTTVSATIVPGSINAYARHDFPAILASDGTPLYTKNGHFIGITSNRQIVRRRTLRKLLQKGGQP